MTILKTCMVVNACKDCYCRKGITESKLFPMVDFGENVWRFYFKYKLKYFKYKLPITFFNLFVLIIKN